MSDQVEILVVGAGVVGMAVASALADAGHEVVVIERHSRPGEETSSRNSGVIHSGIYYPTGSLKARLCVAGRSRLYQYCADRGIAHRRCGKLIVGQTDQLKQLATLQKKAQANGVTDLQWLDAAEVGLLEPQVSCAAALLSPSTGIVDVHELILSLQADLQAHGGDAVFNTEFISARADGKTLATTIRSGDTSSHLSCNYLINCAGLQAPQLLRKIDAYPIAHFRPTYYAKGNYFACHGVKPFRHLVYPVPNEAGLGVHATLDLDGTTRFGPDVEWVQEIDYSVDPNRAIDFYSAIREYWPALPNESLQPAYAGIRPKLVGPSESAADFMIEGAASHGVQGLVNLLGIESPGLTSSLAIGDWVVAMLE